MSKYAEIIERLAKADGPSFDGVMNIDIFCTLFPDAEWQRCVIGRYDCSIDAALALVEKMLKTYSLTMTDDLSGQGAKILYWPNGLSDAVEIGPVWGVSHTMPLAILQALFRALEAKETLS